MPTIKWDKYTKCLVSEGFTEEQEEVLAAMIPSGFVENLRKIGLDPKTFKIIIGREQKEKEEAQEQMGIFLNG